jgi:hypothetical protein
LNRVGTIHSPGLARNLMNFVLKVAPTTISLDQSAGNRVATVPCQSTHKGFASTVA